MFLAIRLILAALSSQPCLASSILFSADTVSNSEMKVSGQVDNDVTWVWIRIEQATLGSEVRVFASEDVFPVLVQHQFQQKLYLRSGSGKYKITVRQSVELTQYGNFYHDVSTRTVENQDPRDLSYLLPSLKVQSDDPQILSLALQITDGQEDELSASQAIHDWVATHVAYDVLDYFNGIQKDFSASETLQKRIAYCNGYAHLNAALHRAVGIPAKIIYGQARSDSEEVNHEWNEILIEGNWIIEDPTWDAGGIAFGTRDFHFKLIEKYFNPNKVEFEKDHTFIQVLTNE